MAMKAVMLEPKKQTKRLKKMIIKKSSSKKMLKKKTFKLKKAIEPTVEGEILAKIELP